MKAEAGQSGNYYDWDEKQYKNKDTGKTVDADVAIASHMDDNGYDEKGNQVNNKGGDTTDYLYGKGGKIISSTSVKLKNISQGEFGSNGGKLRGYGFKGWKMATGNSESMEFSSPIFPMSAVLKPFLGALLGTTKIAGTSVFRAVDATERGIINSTGKFSFEAGVLESKYFAQSLQDAHWYGKGLYPNGYSIIEATVKSPVDASQYWFPHIDIGAFVFPAETLPYIIPK
ncbi:hypothetical protein [Flavobacterium sp. N502540]|uniref:hypothetical protein n=1 Tax=Flavobacterium sp. N502540 TaxID=2986838 RepID=UPI0022251E35|nr:hypothetical protein [Flavobacterium sp. N502540]